MNDIPRRLLLDFAHRTGLSNPDATPQRYLWTDAFAVCGFLGLHGDTGDREALELARHLVTQTHRVLGRHRADDTRSGWISGLSHAEGEAHPTIAGLRIGKPMPERSAEEPFDERDEWDRDGQYFHYLTRWMHALNRMEQVTGERVYHRQACELARAAWNGFTRVGPDGHLRLLWKMSIDLSRPQIASSGHHDALDGLVTFARLQARGAGESSVPLDREIHALSAMCAGQNWWTDDSLGIGGLLCDAYWLAPLAKSGQPLDPGLPEELLRSALQGLEALLAQGGFRQTADRRLAFRELGLTIGLRAMLGMTEATPARIEHSRLRSLVAEPSRHLELVQHIESFWLDRAHRESALWSAHRDINDVMLASSLAPAGYLGPSGEGAR